MREGPERRRLSRQCLVRSRHRKRRRRNRRGAHHRRPASDAAVDARTIHRLPDTITLWTLSHRRRPDRPCHADRARDRARHRQRDLHLDPRRQAAAGGAGSRPPHRPDGGDGDAHPAVAVDYLDHAAHGAALQRPDLQPRALGPRSDPCRWRAVPALQGDARDSREARRRGRPRHARAWRRRWRLWSGKSWCSTSSFRSTP